MEREGGRDLNLQSRAFIAKSDAGTSSSNTRGGAYQVFLNFCGRDTRCVFTEFLHRELENNCIYSFIDDEGLRVGEEIDRELMRAIDDSQIYIPIFSRNYAHSKWCLRELKRMVENMYLSEDKKLLPIFYDVKPDDVDLKTTLYKTAIENHEEEHKKKFPQGGVSWEGESWKEALKKVDKIKGWELPKCKSAAELTSFVVKEVLRRLERKYKTVTSHLVGLDGRVAEIRKLLDVDCISAVRLLLLYGIGGIGKTTLAKVIYNELSSRFEKCSFLDDVGETSKEDSLLLLQKKLLTEIVGSKSADIIYDVHDGKRRIEETLGRRKVFIVLDNVDDEKQIENLMGQGRLYPGTRIIITTRNKSVVKKQRRAREMESMNSDWSPEILTYEMKGMNPDHALELFTRHASFKGSLEKDFDKLSRAIVNTTGGLPLALEVIGAFLYGQDEARWKETLNKLKLIPFKDVRKKLMISYEALEDDEREIFLDVACFLIDEDVTNAIDMWTDCNFFPKLAIDVLVNMSLIKIKNENKFWMHDQLRDLGRDIVRRGSPENLGRRSRLWTSDEVLDFVRTKKRKENVKALDLHGGSSYISISNEEIERFESLRFLRLSNGAFVGDFIACPKLRWISWCSPPSYFNARSVQLRNLLVLELFDNHFADDSRVWDSFKMATKLKSLALVRCHCLTRTPDLSGCLTLERLTFDNCQRLKEIDSSIGMLTCLLDLNIIRCRLIEQVPNEIGGLVKLERFSLNGCHKVCGLPTSIGNLASLRKMDLSMSGMRSLPDSIEKLSCLLDLNLFLSKIREIPNAIEGLVELRCLDLRATRISQLTDSIGKLKSLCILDLSLPQIGIRQTGIYPNSWKLPKAIGKLDKLEELDLSHYTKLAGEIPDEIGYLSSLRVLKLSWTGISGVPGTINMLSRLSTLDLTWCDEITELPELPVSLIHLCVESRSLQTVPNLSKLTNLVELVLSDRSLHSSNLKHKCDLRWIGRLFKLEKLELRLLNIPVPPVELRLLSLMEDLTLLCLDLQPLEQLPPSLLSLVLDNFSSTGLPQSNLDIPSNLTLRFSRLQEIQLHEFSRLQHLRLDRCDLQSLSISSSVRTLKVSGCPNVIEIHFLDLSTSLEELSIDQCGSIGRIVLCGEGEPFDQSESSSSESTYRSPRVLLPYAKKLKRLKLSSCKKLLEIQVIGTLLSLREISIYSCWAMKKFGVSNLKNLDCLVINRCFELGVVEGLDELEFLSMLDVAYCHSLEILLDISNSKIPHKCLIRVTHCGDSLISSPEDPEYIPFKRYKEMAQRGAPQSETNKVSLNQDFIVTPKNFIDLEGRKFKEEAKMEGDAVEPEPELQSQFHPSAGSRDHEISEPPIDNVREGTPLEKQYQMTEQDSNPLSLDELAPPRTFCDRFKTCLVSILECVCNCDFPYV